MVLTRKHIPLTSTKRVGSVTWENEFKYSINELLEYAVAFEDLEGYIRGLDLSYDPSNGGNILISPGACIADTVDAEIISTTQLTLNYNSANVGQPNGFDQAFGVDTWLYIYVIKNPTTDAVACFGSQSDSSPTLPSGYTKKRLIGAVYLDSTANWRKFFQQTTGSSREFIWESFTNILNGASPTANTWTNLDLSSYVPTSSKSRWVFIHLGCRTNATALSSTTYETRVRTNGSSATNGYFSYVRSVNGEVVGDSSIDVWVKTDASGIVQYLRNATPPVVDLDVLGYRMEV